MVLPSAGELVRWFGPLAMVAGLAASMAAGAAGLAPPAGGYLAIPRLCAVLVAGPLVAVAAAVAWRRAPAATGRWAPAWQALRLRGASLGTLARALLWSWVPQVGAAILAAVLGTAWAVLASPWRTAPAEALLWAGAGSLVVACASLGGSLRASMASPDLARRGRSGRESWHAGWWLDALPLVAGGAVGVALWLQGGAVTLSASLAQDQAVFGGSLLTPGSANTGTAVQTMPHLGLVLLVAPPLLLVGLGAAAGYILSLGARLLDGVASGSVPAIPLLAVRALARGAHGRRLVTPMTLTIAVVAFVGSGWLGLARTDRVQQDVRLGADAAVPLSWAAPCTALPVPRHPSGIRQPSFGTETVCRSSPAAALPDVSAAVAHLPGTVAATVLLTATQAVPGAEMPAEYIGVDPATFGATVRWPAALPGPEARALAALASGEAVVSPQLAAEAHVQPGDTLPGLGLTAPSIGLVLPLWPGLGTAEPFWAVLNAQQLAPVLQGPYGRGQRTGRLLLRLRPHAQISSVLRAIGSSGMQAGTPRLPLGGAGLGGLWPLAAVSSLCALILVWLAHGATHDDPDGLPGSLAVDVLAAEEEVRAARHSLRWVTGVWGVAWGLGAGTAAAALFWPDLRLGLPAAPPVPFMADWSGLDLGAGVAALGLVALARVLVRTRWWGGRPARHPRPAARSPRPERKRSARALPVRGQPRGVWLLPLVAAQRLAASGWRVLALGTAMLLVAAVAVAIPTYTSGAMTQVLRAGLLPHDQRPAGALLTTLEPRAEQVVSAGTLQHMAAITATIPADLGLEGSPPVEYLGSPRLVVRDLHAFVSLDAVRGWTQHVQLYGGRIPAPHLVAGALEVAVTPETESRTGLLLGQTYRLALPGGGDLQVRVVGLVEPRQGAGAFWPFQDLSDELLARTDTVQLLLGPTGILPLEMASWYSVLDLRGLKASQVPQTVRTLRHLGTEVAGAVPGAQLGVSPLPVLQSFLFRQQALVALLRVMSIPATALLLAFLILTAWLVVDSQAVEIAVLTSRGARRGQIVGIYLLEWVLLALPAAGLAPLLALGVARVVGSTRGFLDFAPGSPLPGGLAWSDWAQALAAVGVAVLTALVPVLLRCRGVLPGVQQQQARAPGWAAGQRVPAEGVVAVLLALGWLWARQATVRTGGLGAIVKSPGLFLLPVGLMLLGALVAERLVRQLARALERGSGRRLPALVLLPLRRLERRTHRSAGILALILFTAGSATYTATVATALIRNLASATGYRVGAQVRLLQTSPCLTLPLLSGVCATYDPVFPRLAGGEVRPLPPFSLNLRPGGVRTATEMPELGVQAYPSGAGAMRSANQRANAAATLVLVDPQGYGRTVSWQPSWMPLPEGTYLRLLERPDGVLVSPAVGAAGERLLVADGGSNAEFSILGTVPRWPGADISGNLVLANLAGARALLHLTCGPEPCIGSRVVLMDLRPGASLGAIQTELQGYGLYSLATDDAGSELATALASPEWTGTTGLLTLGFVVALLLMAVGYYMVAEIMVRWDASELALLRSLGLGRAGTWLQLVLEHLGLVLAGAAGGLGAGWAACSLFLPLLRPAFSGPNAPPFLLVGPGSVLGPLALALVLMLAATFLAFVWLLRNLALEERLREAA